MLYNIIHLILCFFILSVLFVATSATAQIKDSIRTLALEERVLEDALQQDDNRINDDEWQQQREILKQSKIYLNKCDANALKQSTLLNDLQIKSFIQYRTTMGKLISVYELQAIPYFDSRTIKKILPFISIEEIQTQNEIKKYHHTLLLRTGWSNNNDVIDATTPSNQWLGSAQRAMIRYTYQQKNWQAGFVVEKDAGEKFTGPIGFDHTSFHAVLKKLGSFENIIIGDYTINTGQGLMQWQNFALGKGAEIMNIKRTGATLRPYNSSGEFFYYRGIATQWHCRAITITAFASQRKLSVISYIDTLTGKLFFSSINVSGYHRTALELERKNNNTLQSSGAIIQYENDHFSMGIQAVSHGWSMLYQPRTEPYQYVLAGGRHMMNAGMFYDYTWHNYHFFGEYSIDKQFNHAILQGALIGVNKFVDISLLYRNIQPSYQAIFTNAFIASTHAQNEKGIYAGIQIKPNKDLRISAFVDMITYPWLRYQIDAPSTASDYFIQLEYKPTKTLEWLFRFRTNNSIQNGNVDEEQSLVNIKKDQIRCQVSVDNAPISFSMRIDANRYTPENAIPQTGISSFFNVSLRFPQKPWSAQVRLGYFDTDSYDTRLFAFENDVLFKNTLSTVWGTGWRFYINGKYNVNKHITFFSKIGSTQRATVNDKNPSLKEYQTFLEYTVQALLSF